MSNVKRENRVQTRGLETPRSQNNARLERIEDTLYLLLVWATTRPNEPNDGYVKAKLLARRGLYHGPDRIDDDETTARDEQYDDEVE